MGVAGGVRVNLIMVTKWSRRYPQVGESANIKAQVSGLQHPYSGTYFTLPR